MIGNKQILVRSLVQYYYSGGDCDGEEPAFQPPTGGRYVRCDSGEGGSGTVVIVGTYGGEDVTETITSFDSEGVAFGTQPYDTISSISVALIGATSITIYPADDVGNNINYNTYTESYIRCNWEYTSSTANNRVAFNVGGEKLEAEIKIQYNINYDVRMNDLLYIDSRWFKVGMTQKASKVTRIAYLTNTGEVAT